MDTKMTQESLFVEKVLLFYKYLSQVDLTLQNDYRLLNPFTGDQSEFVKEITAVFYRRYYSDNKQRRIVLGSSPARRKSAIIGVPFEEINHLLEIAGFSHGKTPVSKTSSGFLYEMIEKYGGYDVYYSDFYMSFVCPLGIIKTNSKGHDINCNYYENKALKDELESFIIESLMMQLEFNIDKSVCYCIGCGENYRYLSSLNQKYHFFGSIKALEHPRYIMQYHAKQKEIFLHKYIKTLQGS